MARRRADPATIARLEREVFDERAYEPLPVDDWRDPGVPEGGINWDPWMVRLKAFYGLSWVLFVVIMATTPPRDQEPKSADWDVWLAIVLVGWPFVAFFAFALAVGIAIFVLGRTPNWFE